MDEFGVTDVFGDETFGLCEIEIATVLDEGGVGSEESGGGFAEFGLFEVVERRCFVDYVVLPEGGGEEVFWDWGEVDEVVVVDEMEFRVGG